MQYQSKWNGEARRKDMGRPKMQKQSETGRGPSDIAEDCHKCQQQFTLIVHNFTLLNLDLFEMVPFIHKH